MIQLFLIGIGTGNPEHLTLQALRALNATDLVLIPRKGAEKADLADLRRTLCAEVLTNPATRLAEFDLPTRSAEGDYHGAVDNWHDAIAHRWESEIRKGVGTTGKVALLVWGDPSLYDSSLRIAARVGRRLPLEVTVVPGITSMQSLTAAHAMAVNEIGAPFLVTTGRQLRDKGWPEGIGTLVVMLDGGCAFQRIDPEGVTIWWGAYVGMPQQVILSGSLAETGPRILALRELERARHGWIMDIYILRR